MKNKIFMLLSLIATSLILSSCESEDELGTFEKKTQVTFSVDNFDYEGGLTRTDCDPANNFAITWADGDVIGIFPLDNYQEPFKIPADQVGQTSVSFDGGSWALKSGKTYNAYYPFDEGQFKENGATCIPVTYIGQSQTGTACSVGAFDYTYSNWATAGSGALNFNFHHIGSFLVLSLELPATGTYTSLTLKTENAVIPAQGTYDLTASTPAFVATGDKTNALSMELKDFSGTAGETAVFYMMVPPMDLTAETPKVVLSNGTESCVYTIPNFNITVKAAKLYKRTGTPVSSDVTGTVDGWVTDSEDPLCFTAQEAGSTIKLFQRGTATSKSKNKIFSYSTDGNSWSTYTLGTVLTLDNIGDKVYFKSLDELPCSESPTISRGFSMTGKFAASGDIQSLVNYSTVAAECGYAGMFYGAPITSAPKLSATVLNGGCYISMFELCKSLATAPALPAMSLAQECYEAMFRGCTSLTTAPTSLPATTLASSCYQYMFYGCTSLTSAPQLPATTLASVCYQYMFQGCTSLETAPALPATTLANYCYSDMFYGCTSLETAPVLSATTLTFSCYSQMFYGCTSLETAPALPATTLAIYCYSDMFYGCTSLTTAPALPATTLANYCYSSMFSGCKSLTTAPALPATTLATSCYRSMFYGCTSLTTAPALSVSTLADGCYSSMFRGCTSLTTPPALPATTLANQCYSSMFQGCTSLKTAPTLPATTLAENCYSNMFSGCTSLETVPALPATTLANYCYSGMLIACTSLKTAPTLPATTLAESCYSNMFQGCTSLETAPALPATTLADYCYYWMFKGCTSLESAPVLPATILVDGCYMNMFNGCTSLESAPVLPATTLVDGCYMTMFSGCSNLKYVKAMFTTTPEVDYTGSWLYGVATNGTFVKNAAASWDVSGSTGIPSGWTVETATE